MTFNWIDFVNSHNIPYTTSGPNTKRGEISITCPLCSDDPSMHMGINPISGYWGCWRDADHRGRRPHKLIVALLNCSYATAHLIVDQYSVADAGEFDSLDLNFDTEEEQEHTGNLIMPREFKVIKNEGSTRRFWRYLKGRGFSGVNRLVKNYNLRCCTSGEWKDRVIIPIYENDELVSWTARAIAPTLKAPRYKTLSVNEKGPHKALITINNTLFLYDQLTGGEALFLTEGPIDSLKIDFYGEQFDVHATCLFTSSITIDQIYLISEVSKRYKATWLLLDPEAIEQQLDICDMLARYGVRISELEPDVEDPGAMSKKQVLDLIKSVGVKI